MRPAFYSIWFNFGRYSVVQIERIMRTQAVGRLLNGRAETIRLCHLYGEFGSVEDAKKSINAISRIHKAHADHVAKTLLDHNNAVKARNDEILKHLKGLS